MKQSEPRQRSNKPSILLTQEENEQVFRLLGNKCQSLATGVIQVFKTEGTAHSHWKKKHTGVLCIIKDSSKKSYFLRTYCLIKNDLVWEHECYETIQIHKPRPYLLTFEGQDGYVALNFASDNECEIVFKELQTIENRYKKKLEKRNRIVYQQQSISTTTSTNDYDLRNNPKLSTKSTNSSSSNTLSSIKPTFFPSSLSDKSKKKKKKVKVTKADIGEPTNFIHVKHCGLDLKNGTADEEVLQSFFEKAGINNKHLKDDESRNIIYNFVGENHIIEKLKSESIEIPDHSDESIQPPSVPSRHQSQNGNNNQRIAPPLPTRQPTIKQVTPARQPPPPIPAPPVTTKAVVATLPNRAAPPTRPPPIHSVTNVATTIPSSIQTQPTAPPPPPPPPPPPMPPPPPPAPSAFMVTQEQKSIQSSEPNENKSSTLPVANDIRSALMESIRKGTVLKPVDTTSLSTGSGDSRSELLSEIRQGIELRPVESRQLPPPSVTNSNKEDEDNGFGTDALAHALRKALIDRGKFIHSSDDDSDDSSDNDREWDD